MGLVKVKYCIVLSIISNKLHHIQYNNQTINMELNEIYIEDNDIFYKRESIVGGQKCVGAFYCIRPHA
jgi:hypothetical protein